MFAKKYRIKVNSTKRKKAFLYLISGSNHLEYILIYPIPQLYPVGGGPRFYFPACDIEL